MAGLEDLFSDPRAAIGYGLLASRENPMGAAFGLLQQGQQMKQNQAENAIRNKILQRQMESLEIERAAEERKQRMQDLLMQGMQGGGMSPEAWQMYGITGGNTAAYQYGKDMQEKQNEQNAAQGVRDIMGGGTEPQGYNGFNLPKLDQSQGGFLDGIGTEDIAPQQAPTEQPASNVQADIDALMQKRQELSLLPKSEYRESAINQIDKEVELLQKQMPSPLERLKIEEANTQKAKGSKIASEGLYYANKLLSNLEGVKRAAGPIGGYVPDVTSSAADAAADIRALGNVLTVENLGLMSGVLSESDIALLRDVAAGGITPTRSDERLIGEIKRIKSTLEKAAVTDGNAPTMQQNSISGLRAEAQSAIEKGANQQAVAQRFKQLTGENL